MGFKFPANSTIGNEHDISQVAWWIVHMHIIYLYFILLETLLGTMGKDCFIKKSGVNRTLQVSWEYGGFSSIQSLSCRKT